MHVGLLRFSLRAVSLVAAVIVGAALLPAQAPIMQTAPAGSFPMGKEGSVFGDEGPVHTVTLSTYEIGKYHVTNGEYVQGLNWANMQGLLTGASGEPYAGGPVYASGELLVRFDGREDIEYLGGVFTSKQRAGVGGALYSMENHPMVNVTWYGAVAYCNWLSAMNGLPQCYDFSNWALTRRNSGGYRLPSEAEWERAAAWDGTRHWQFGFMSDEIGGRGRANYRAGDGFVNPLGLLAEPLTAPVGWFNGINVSPRDQTHTLDSPSPLGCYDMTGNVWNWCQDWYGPYAGEPQTDPLGPANGMVRVIRGGGWADAAFYIASTNRHVSLNGDLWYHGIGFRLARTPLLPIQVLSPNGGELLTNNSTIRVQWLTDVDIAGTAVRMEIWSSQGFVADLGSDWNPDGQGDCTVYLPALPSGTDYRLRIESAWTPTLFDESDGPFTINGNSVRIIWPSGPMEWGIGSSQLIVWSSYLPVSGSAVAFELWQHGVKQFNLGTGWDPSGVGASLVHVPESAVPGDYQLRVISLWNAIHYASSEEDIRLFRFSTGRSSAEPVWQHYE